MIVYLYCYTGKNLLSNKTRITLWKGEKHNFQDFHGQWNSHFTNFEHAALSNWKKVQVTITTSKSKRDNFVVTSLQSYTEYIAHTNV